MRIVEGLSETRVRILGALLEKEQATPAQYPLTVNALLAACNQKTNRDPVMTLSEEELWDELDALRAEVLVWRSEGARTQRWSQSISRRLELDPEEKALLTVLMLRGPQTAGELRTRSQRLHAFGDLAEVEAALLRLADENRDLVAQLPRRPGQKESRWAQLLGEGVEEATEPASTVESAAGRSGPRSGGATPKVSGEDLSERVARLERLVAEIGATLERIGSERE